MAEPTDRFSLKILWQQSKSMENLTLGRKFPSGLLSDTPFHLPCSMAQRVKALLWSQAA